MSSISNLVSSLNLVSLDNTLYFKFMLARYTIFLLKKVYKQLFKQIVHGLVVKDMCLAVV